MAMMLLGGCRITKESIAQSTMTTAKQRTDSTKYAKVTDAFLNGEFVFKINRKGDKKVDPTDNNIVISNGMFHYQYVKYANMDLPGIFQGSGQPPIKIESGKIHEVKESYDAKKKIFTIHYRNAVTWRDVSLSLFENSDKAFGYLGSSYYIEGWIEPLDGSTVPQGFKSIIFD